jgi:hypothetical protein
MLRRYHATAPGVWGALGSLFLYFFIPFLLLRANIELVDATLYFFGNPPFGLKSSDFTLSALWETVSSTNAIQFAGIISLTLTALGCLCILLFGIGVITSEVLRMQANRLKGESGSAHSLAAQIARAIRLAALAYRRAPGNPAQQEALGNLSSRLHDVYDGLLRISDLSASVGRRSNRRGKLREHHLKVIAALQEKEAAIDVDVRAALPDLAETLVRIVDAYSDGKIGQLLPASEIDHVALAEVAKGEHFKMLAIAILLGGCGILVAFLDLPDTATTSLIGAIGITTASMVYGRKARQAMDVLDSVRGIQRP